MSDPNLNAQAPQGQPQPAAPQQLAPEVATAPAMPAGVTAPTGRAPKPPKQPRVKGEKKEGLSTFLKVSIILLAGLTLASISLLFIGDFEGKFERVFSTFMLFAVFVCFTALDTRREQRSEWYAPVALIANAYILGLLLIVIWMTKYDQYVLLWDIFWKSLFVIVVTRAVILCCQLLIQMGEKLTTVVARFAFVTSMLAVLSGILFTAPVGLEAFTLHIPDLYWKIATALLILTALGLSITLLLRWNHGSGEREALRKAREAQQEQARAMQLAGYQLQPQLQQQFPVAQVPMQQAQVQAQVQAQQQQVQAQQAQQQQAQAQQPQLLPWPTFADGRPLPAGPDGQPDFSVAQQPNQ